MEIFLQTLLSSISDASLYLMLSVGLALTFGVLGVVNFAQGDFMTVAAYLGIAAIGAWGLSPTASLVVMVPALMLVGALFFVLVLKPTENHPHESRLLATFGVAFILQGLVWRIWSANPEATIQSLVTYHWGDLNVPADLVRNVTVTVVAMAFLFLFLYRSSLGREIRATAEDAIGAELIGIDTKRAQFVTTILASGLTAIGGLMILSTSTVYPQVGFSLILKAFAVVILAGLGSIVGVVFASLILGLATEFVASYVDPSYADVVAFVVIIVVLLVRPTGIAGKPVA